MKKGCTLLSILLLILLINCNSFSQILINSIVENTGTSCSLSASKLVKNEKLPNPFIFNDGSSVNTFEDWICRRNEIKADIEKYEIMEKPDRPSEITASYSGNTLTVVVYENGKSLTLTSRFSLPSGSGPHPIVIGMNRGTGSLSSSLFEGVVQVPFMHDQVCTYRQNGSKDLNAPFYQMYSSHSLAGDYCGWSWGVSRLIDGLELVAAQLNLDMGRIAVTGCSYAGKMALFAGAFDERVTLTIVQESGGGGINSWRTSQEFTDRTGTNIEKINNTNGSWFMQSMRSLDPYMLPHDHHELIAMIAPRAFLALGNPDFEWLGDESGYKSCGIALEVWKAMGIEDRFGFDFASGHNHCFASSSQNAAVSVFVNKFLRNDQSANTFVREKPNYETFVLDFSHNIDWAPLQTIAPYSDIPSVVITSPTVNTCNLYDEILIAANVRDINNDAVLVEFYINDSKIGEDTNAPYSTNWTADVSGVVNIQVKVTDSENNTGERAKSIQVSVLQEPYGKIPHVIPGLIEFEHFDLRGNGNTYKNDSSGTDVQIVMNAKSQLN
jgi:hypothetical protein